MYKGGVDDEMRVCSKYCYNVHEQINNAGCMVNQRELTDDGLEKNFATNTLGKNKNIFLPVDLMIKCYLFLMYRRHSYYTIYQVPAIEQVK